MTDDPKNETSKIIIDEDWKSKVEAEKQAAGQQPPESEAARSRPDAAPAPLPPATLTFLLGSLYLQGMVSLGLLPNPGSDKPEVHLDLAQHSIDLLDMLQEKTKGNRTDEESRELDTILHELRMAYVQVQTLPNR